jgi:uncharacterized membrane protein
MNQKQSRETRSKKRAKFTQSASGQTSTLKWWLLGGGALLAVALVAWLWRGSSTMSTVEIGDLPPERDGAFRLPAATFEDGHAHWYTYQAEDREIEFFVLKSSDGAIRAAFNACDVCFLDKEGYRQEGDEMVCNACGQRFPSKLINEVRGGCNPSPLERTMEGDEVVIRVDDILAGARYF